MSWEESKFQAFKEFLMRTNPSIETAVGMQGFLTKWLEYKQTMNDSVKVIMTDEMKEYLEFLKIVKLGGLA